MLFKIIIYSKIKYFDVVGAYILFLCNIHNASTTSNPKKVQIREFNQIFLFSIVGKTTENSFVFENRNIFNIYYLF